MNSERWDVLQTLYLEALERDPSDRERFLREACRDDESLFEEIRSLLSVEIHPLLEGLAVDAVSWASAAARPGDVVGRYRLLERIGEGGMGVVYRAARADGAYEQTVALKLVKPGMDFDAVLRRFRAERQILAGLRHPGIARLLDGGSHDGRPYLAVEYVDGESITAYCDRRGLGIDARIVLFEQVCEAVSYAHQNLVVHRDLKPSNILVTEAETDTPTVKLLDFGIARLLEGDGGEAAAALTQIGERVLTPAYAAPEQVVGDRVTTATDVYGLGVVLYELLTGSRPVEPDGNGLVALERAVLYRRPASPSTAAITAAATAARSASAGQLKRRLAGDLDTIVLKALRKEPERRYATAEGLLHDLKRHRQNLPVAARPDTPAYRIRKFLKRNRAGAATAIAVVLLVATIAAVAFEQVRLERDRAQQEAAAAATTAGFLQEIFAVSNPSESTGETVTARELLERGASRIETELEGQPVLQAEMMHVVGEVYASLGLLDQAEKFLQRALAQRRALLGDDDPDVGRTLEALGVLFEMQGRYHEAITVDSAAVAIFRLRGDEPFALAKSLHSLAHAHFRLDRYEEAERFILEAISIKRRLFGSEHREVAYSLNILADIYTGSGRYTEAESTHRDVLAMRRRLLGDDHLDVGVTLHNLGATLLSEKKYEEAEESYRGALQIWEKVYGPESSEYPNSLSQMAYVVGELGRYEEADSMHLEAIAMARQALGDEHPRIGAMYMRYGNTLRVQGRFSEAEAAYREAIAMHRKLLGETPALPTWLTRLGDALRMQRRFREAEDVLLEAQELCAAQVGAYVACREQVRDSLADLYSAWERPEQRL